MDEKGDRVYLVSGISNKIALNIHHEDLPTIVETRLHSISDNIIYDVFINRIPIKIGPNMQQTLQEKH